MERASEPGESEQPSIRTRPSKYRIYTLDELPTLFDQWRREEPDPEEIARRTRLFRRAARWRRQLAGSVIPVDELLRQAREELTGG